jgi:hypothetical protein
MLSAYYAQGLHSHMRPIFVEAIGADLNAPKELCDDCAKQFPDGLHMPGGLWAETYFDQLAALRRGISRAGADPEATPGY